MSDSIKAVRAYLVADANITAVVSTRIYGDVLPQNATMPAIVLTYVTGTTEHHFGNAANISSCTIQVDTFASTRQSANTTAELVRNRMDGYRGTMGSEAVKCCHMQRQQQMVDEPDDASDQWRYRVIQDYLIWLTETVPSR